MRLGRLSEGEYRALVRILHEASGGVRYATTVDIIRLIALTGCRRSEIISLKWSEVDIEASCLRPADSKDGASVRPVGLPVIERLESLRTGQRGAYVFPSPGSDSSFGSFALRWKQVFRNTPLSDVTPHVLRHNFASLANDLGFTEATIAALVGHAKCSAIGNYIHTLDTALIMAANTLSG